MPAVRETAAEDDSEIAWVRRAFTALARYLTGGKYVNFMDADEGAEVPDAYGARLQRLRTIKRRYDPDNVLRLNQNITVSAESQSRYGR